MPKMKIREKKVYRDSNDYDYDTLEEAIMNVLGIREVWVDYARCPFCDKEEKLGFRSSVDSDCDTKK